MEKHAIAPFALERFFARYEFTTRHVLCSSDPETMTVSELLALESGADRRLAALPLGYIDSRGTPELREAIAALYENASAGDVLAHSGTQEPIFTLMHALLEPGDHLVVQFPAYQSQYSVAESIGAEVTRWEADLDRGGAPDIGLLERLLRPQTRAIVITTPNNPTGYQFGLAEFDAVLALARKRGTWVVCDEVYRGSEREASALPAVADRYERGVSLGGTAKAYGLAGLRIGWVATQNAPLLEKMAALKDYLTICNSGPSEMLAALALRHAGELAERVKGITARNLDLLDAFFARRADRFNWTRPRAGTVAFPRYRGGSSEGFCTRLVERAGVLLLPSALFEAGDAHFRIGYGRASLPDALCALDDFMNSQG